LAATERDLAVIIGEGAFAFRRKTDVIAAEAALDFYVRTNLPKRVLGNAARQLQADNRTHRGRSAGAQLPNPPRRPCHLLPHPGHHRPQREISLHPSHQANPED
jgi:hypothetical protein